MSEALAWTAWALRRAIGCHDFSEQHLVVLDFILLYSLDRKSGRREKAFFPVKQYELADMAGLDPGDFSKALKWLRTQSVIEVEEPWYWLTPPAGPPGWTAPVRVKQTAEIKSSRDWLDQINPEQPELLPPPPSLRDALLEVFVESCRKSASVASSNRDETRRETRDESRSSWIGSSSSESGSKPAVGNFPIAGQPEGRAIGKFPISHEIPRSRDPEIEITDGSRSRETSTRSREISQVQNGTGSNRVSPIDLHYVAYVEGRLFEVAGAHERAGRCGEFFCRCCRVMPERVDELLSVALDLKKTNRLQKSIGAWLNRTLYLEMEERRERK